MRDNFSLLEGKRIIIFSLLLKLLFFIRHNCVSRRLCTLRNDKAGNRECCVNEKFFWQKLLNHSHCIEWFFFSDRISQKFLLLNNYVNSYKTFSTALHFLDCFSLQFDFKKFHLEMNIEISKNWKPLRSVCWLADNHKSLFIASTLLGCWRNICEAKINKLSYH